MELNTIHCGECAETMQDHIPDNSIDLTITSPPYDNLREYKGYTFDFEKIAAQLWRVTKPGGVVVWVVGDATIDGSETGTSFRQALGFMGLGFNLHDTMIWEKTNPLPQNHNRYEQYFEYMFVFTKGQLRTFNPQKSKTMGAGKIYGWSNANDYGDKSAKRKRDETSITKNTKNASNIRKYPVASSKFTNSAPFPEALARDHIISWSNPGDIILDPMCGSGTTLKMAVEQGRKYIGIDISQEYVDLSQKRVEGARVPLPGIF